MKPNLKKKRVNITIGQRLHANAVHYAEELEMDFSEFVSHLIRREIERATSPSSEESATNMPPRNKPCPCGSSTKFKHCCESTWPVLKSRQAAHSHAVS